MGQLVGGYPVNAHQPIALAIGRADGHGRRGAPSDPPNRPEVITVVAVVFSLWLMAGAGFAAVCQGALFLFAGVLVYVVMAARRRRGYAEPATP